MERPNIHPGEILREEFLKPTGISPEGLALELDLPAERVDGIVGERQSVCAETAIRLSRYFGTSERFWMEIQMVYDLERARRKGGESIRRIIPHAGFS